MKTYLVIVLTLCAGIALAADSEQAVKDAEKAWASAVAARDFNALDALLGDKLIYAHSTGVVETKQEYVGKMKAGTQKYDRITHENMRVVPYGDTAVAHSTVRMTGTNAQGPFDNKLMMIHVWAKDSEKWQLVAHQTTRLTQ
jgi:ketosteroid isomerase-like protein